MALVVEDGTGLSTAESYISVVDASTYHTARGNATWAALASDTVREQALRKATDYMGAVYGLRWSGDRVLAAQALDWPRYNVAVHGFSVDSDVVPTAVANACAELALRAAADDLLPDIGAQVKSETVGPISVVYADGARQSDVFRQIEAMLAAYFSGRGQLGVVRA